MIEFPLLLGALGWMPYIIGIGFIIWWIYENYL